MCVCVCERCLGCSASGVGGGWQGANGRWQPGCLPALHAARRCLPPVLASRRRRHALHPPTRAAATAMVAHKVSPDTTIGAEVVRDLAAGTTSFAAGAHGRMGARWRGGRTRGAAWLPLPLLLPPLPRPWPPCAQALASLSFARHPACLSRAGLSKQQADGALTKLKLEHTGIVSVLYEQVGAAASAASASAAAVAAAASYARLA